MAKLTFQVNLCKGCGLCERACPKGLIVIAKDKLNQRGFHPAELTDAEKCTGCASCAVMCPDCVISVER